jgi:hypothetical protein
MIISIFGKCSVMTPYTMTQTSSINPVNIIHTAPTAGCMKNITVDTHHKKRQSLHNTSEVGSMSLQYEQQNRANLGCTRNLPDAEVGVVATNSVPSPPSYILTIQREIFCDIQNGGSAPRNCHARNCCWIAPAYIPTPPIPCCQAGRWL